MQSYYIESCKDNAQTIQAILDQCKGQTAELIFKAGTYYLEKGLEMTAEHQGITLRGEGNVQLCGSKKLAHWEKVEGKPIANRFDEAARPFIYMCDLKKEGITQVGDFISRGFKRPIAASHSEIFCNSQPMKLSQYPKGNDFLTISAVGEEKFEPQWKNKIGVLESGFYYKDERPKSWAPSSQICALGYWGWDWANSTEKVAYLDAQKGFVQTQQPYGVFYFKESQRFRFYHILEEVNCPGDYYVDAENLVAYIYPEDLKEGTEICLSLLATPLLTLTESKDICIENLTFEMTRGYGLFAENTENVTIDNCCFRNIGNFAIEFFRGHRNSVLNCSVYDCGDGGVMMLGGDRRSLETADFKVHNTHFYRIANWTKCYYPPITLIGVGMCATHNLIHDCPHTAIMYWGNEMTIEDNEIYSVVMETGDAGAIYTGRDYTFRGNSVSHNYIHHLGGVGIGTMGIYNDDAVSGTLMANNYFEEVAKGAFMGGGRDFILRNNVFVKCYPAMAIDSRGADDHGVWREMVEKTLRERFYKVQSWPEQGIVTPKQKMLIENTPVQTAIGLPQVYLERYPELAEIDAFYQNPVNGETRIPASAHISHNVICSKVKFRYRYEEPTKTYYKFNHPITCDKYQKSYITDTTRDMLFTIGGEKASIHYVSNYPAVPEDFEDASWGNLTVKKDSKAYTYGYQDADFSSIGLQLEKRNTHPPMVRTRLRLAEDDKHLLFIDLRNEGEREVNGELNLFAPPAIELSTDTILFEIKPGEEKTYQTEIPLSEEAFEIEVRCRLAGVRPSRIYVE